MLADAYFVGTKNKDDEEFEMIYSTASPCVIDANAFLDYYRRRLPMDEIFQIFKISGCSITSIGAERRGTSKDYGISLS